MERLAMQDLIKWKEFPYRKPLIVKGVRQVGKTWLLKEFGRKFYSNTAYFNFDEYPEYREFFSHTKDVKRIIPNLAMASGQDIQPERTLLIFDEIQDCPEVINSLKYFCENAPEYHVACAGSEPFDGATKMASHSGFWHCARTCSCARMTTVYVCYYTARHSSD